jgi:hypothetical protein
MYTPKEMSDKLVELEERMNAISFKEKDTLEIQKRSVINFMDILGFYYEGSCFSNFTSNISWKEALWLHNYSWDYIDGSNVVWEMSRCTVTEDLLVAKLAQASKLVRRAKLQWCKNSKKLIAHNHKVKFVHPEYYNYFFEGE